MSKYALICLALYKAKRAMQGLSHLYVPIYLPAYGSKRNQLNKSVCGKSKEGWPGSGAGLDTVILHD